MAKQREDTMLDTTRHAAFDALIRDLERALVAQDADAVADLFLETGFWRDLAAFTWNIRTCEGREEIRAMAAEQLAAIKPESLHLDPAEEVAESGDVTEGWLRFETATGRGVGYLRMKDGRIWTLLTTLHELKGHEEPRGLRRPMGAEHGHDPDRKTWKEKREAETARLGYEEQPYVLIIGGGQGGIALGARLRQLNVPTIIVDRHARPGDQWRSRYKSLCLHDPVWYDHLPYIPFPDNWPVFAPKDKVGDWLEMYTRVMELNYWSSTTAKSAQWDEARKEWTVTVDRDGEEVVLRPKQLVLATGMSGKPNVPTVLGQDIFRGEQHHSSGHPGPDAYAEVETFENTPVSIGEVRADKTRSAADWTPREALVELLRRIDSGEYPGMDALILCWRTVKKTASKALEINSYYSASSPDIHTTLGVLARSEWSIHQGATGED